MFGPLVNALSTRDSSFFKKEWKKLHSNHDNATLVSFIEGQEEQNKTAGLPRAKAKASNLKRNENPTIKGDDSQSVFYFVWHFIKNNLDMLAIPDERLDWMKASIADHSPSHGTDEYSLLAYVLDQLKK